MIDKRNLYRCYQGKQKPYKRTCQTCNRIECVYVEERKKSTSRMNNP